MVESRRMNRIFEVRTSSKGNFEVRTSRRVAAWKGVTFLHALDRAHHSRLALVSGRLAPEGGGARIGAEF